MPLETSTVDHICSVVRREFAEEMRDLTPIFFVYKTGYALQSIETKRVELKKHKKFDHFMPFITKTIDEKYAATRFLGMYEDKAAKKIEIGPLSVPIYARKNYLAFFFINADDFENALHARQEIYHLTWQAIKLQEYCQNKEREKYTHSGHIVQLHIDKTTQAFNNMIADAFAALMISISGKKGAIPALARRRSQWALKKTEQYRAEFYPFPIAAEATRLVYSDLLTPALAETAPLQHGIQMAKEVGYTFDEHTVDQWRHFALSAQEMAWMGYDKSQILSTAIFTSEDVHMRAVAYLVAETLNLEPGPTRELQYHNPFAEQEVNERRHFKACEQYFTESMDDVKHHKDNTLQHENADMPAADIFTEHARKMNKRLMEGHIIGWCAHALLQAAPHFEDKGKAKDTFETAIHDLKWPILTRISHLIMLQRRRGHMITAEMIIRLCGTAENMRPIAQALKKAPPYGDVSGE